MKDNIKYDEWFEGVLLENDINPKDARKYNMVYNQQKDSFVTTIDYVENNETKRKVIEIPTTRTPIFKNN